MCFEKGTVNKDYQQSYNVYKRIASQMFNKSEDIITSEERTLTKKHCLYLMYGSNDLFNFLNSREHFSYMKLLGKKYRKLRRIVKRNKRFKEQTNE